MSHFPVLVLTQEVPTPDVLNKVLAPYDESIEGNTNYKWDWWVVGGRFRARLQVLDAKQAREGELGVGESIQGKDPSRTGYDVAQRSNLNLEAMVEAIRGRRQKWVDEAFLKLVKQGVSRTEAKEIWRNYVAAGGWASMVDVWEALPEPKPKHPRDYADALPVDNPIKVALDKGVTNAFDDYFGLQIPISFHDPEDWVKDITTPLTCYAFVKDGQWVGQGDMGWFGMSNDKINKDDWDKQTNDLVTNLPPDTWITVVDCHV